MTRAQVENILPELPPKQREMVLALLGGEKTAVQLADRYCLSFSQQLGKARRLRGVPVVSASIPGKPYMMYRLELEEV